MKKTVLIFAILITCSVFIESCSPPVEVEKAYLITQIKLDAEDSLLANVDHSTRIKSIAHSGNYSFRADSTHMYGGTVKIDLNDTLVNSSIRLILNYWMKANNPVKGDGLAVAFQDNNKMVLWSSLDLINYGAKPNEWVNVVDSITIPAENYMSAGMFFKIFAFAPSKQAEIDLDDVNLTVKQIVKVTE